MAETDSTAEQQKRLFKLLGSAPLYLNRITEAVDITRADMPVSTDNPEKILATYLALLDFYALFRAVASGIEDLPEVAALSSRFSCARFNLEMAIRAIKPEEAIGLGYIIEKGEGKLVRYMPQSRIKPYEQPATQQIQYAQPITPESSLPQLELILQTSQA